VILSTPHPGKDLRVGATEPTVMVYGELDDVAKYRKDVGDLTKSNFLHVYLDYVRWRDFAESRGKADWRRCFAPAGSRSGPMVIAAAALDKRIALIWMNVGTCNRWDWQVQYTSGWGPYLTDRLPGQSEADFLKVLGYFDPSHFAERVTIPVCASWGLMDGLSPINGQLSMWVNLRGPKFLELREWGGHDSNTPAFSKLNDLVRQVVFSGQPLPDTGPLGLNWDAWLNGGGR
jgi:cephalosporin-C deacetylase-like acetyl esterase